MIARLLRLLLIKQRAGLRQFLKSLRTPRRSIGLLVTIALIGFGAWQGWRSGAGLGRESLLVLCAMIFVMSVASGLVQQGPRFTPADVDFLFPAPFSPRHLLLWRLLHLWPLALFSSLFMLFMLVTRIERPVRFLIGMFLLQATAMHLQILVAVLLTLVGDTAAKRLHGIGRVVAIVTLLAALLYLVVAISQRGGIGLVVAPLTQAPLARYLLFPAIFCVDFVFGETRAASAFALASLALGALGTLGLLLLPDIDFREDSVATTARIARILAARHRTGSAVDLEEGRRVRSGAVPATRVLFRASGAIVWKNLLLLVRSWKSVLPSLLVGLVLVLPVVLATRSTSLEPAASAIVPIVMVTLFWSNALGFDLRRETDRLDQLRSLPLAPSAIVLAELLIPWALGVSLQEGLVAAISLTGHGDRRGLGLLALVLPILTFLAVVIDNLAVFVFSPSGAAGAARGAMATSSPAQILRIVAWVAVSVPGPILGMWLRDRTASAFWPAAIAIAIEIAMAGVLFTVLVRWYESREVETAD